MVIAPFRLFDEVSKKVIYLKKKDLDKLLLVSIGMCGVIAVGVTLVSWLAGEFSLLTGRVPLILIMIAMLILIGIYFGFNLYPFVIYEQTSKMFAKQSTTVKTEMPDDKMEMEEFNDSAKSIDDSLDYGVHLPKVGTKATNFFDTELLFDDTAVISQKKNETFTDMLEFVNPAIYESTEISEFQNRFTQAISTIASKCSFTENELFTIQKEMNAATNPSKYILENLIESFNGNVDPEDFAFLDELTVGLIPNDFPFGT